MTKTNQPTPYEVMLKSYGVFAEKLTDADLIMGKEGYPDSVGYSLSYTAGVMNNRFGIISSIIWSLPDNFVRVLVNISDSATNQRLIPLQSVEHPQALKEGYLEKLILQTIQQLAGDDSLTVADLELREPCTNLIELAPVLHDLGIQRGYISLRVNNFLKKQTIAKLSVGTPTGAVTSLLNTVLLDENTVEKCVVTRQVTGKLPYTDLHQPNAFVEVVRDFTDTPMPKDMGF